MTIHRLYRRLCGVVALFGLLLPLLTACASTPAASTASPIPTAAIATTPSSVADDPTAAANPTTASAPATAQKPTTAVAEPTASGGAAMTYPLKTSYLEFGVVEHLYYTDRERVLQLTQNAGFDWVRQQIVWKDTEGPEQGHYVWDELDPIVSVVSSYKRKLLVNIVQAPSFYTADGQNGLPEDPTKLGDFVEALAKRYGNQIGAYEIWNEQNLAHETGGHIETSDVGKYVEMVIECYKRIKAVTPEAFVLIGAPSSSGVTKSDTAIADQDYYRAMYTYKDGIIKDYFDAQGVHPGGSANPPETLWPDNPSKAQGWTDDSTFYFRHIENVRKIMEEYGLGNHQIWVTEYGWATANNTPGYEFGNQVSLEQQAQYITGAMNLGATKYQPWLGNMFLWNMNFAVLLKEHNEDLMNEKGSFGILNPDWSPRPSYLAVQSLIDKLKKEQGR